MPSKRKAPPVIGAANGATAKKLKASPLSQPHPNYKESEEYGIVLRKYYPHEMSNTRAIAYNDNEIPRPIEELQSVIRETSAARNSVRPGKSVVHWFKNDLRTSDNTSLFMASEKARELGVPLIGLYIISPQDWEAHLTAPIRVDFTLRTLEVLKADLGRLDIPLYVEMVEKRKDVTARISSLIEAWGANHLYANMEYEVDELRREARLVKMLADKDKAFEVVHDTCIVPPGQLETGTGRQYAVYSPWHRNWVSHIHANPKLLELFDPPATNPVSTRMEFGSLFESKIPEAPANKKLSAEDADQYRLIWPAGEHEAQKRLGKFCEERIGSYRVKRNFPAQNWTSNISVHLSSGTISARTCVRTARDHNTTKKLDGGNEGIQTWMSEVAWRDFYKHVLVHWPYVCMNKPYKPEYSNIEWSYDQGHFEAWTKGRTGFPLVDAAMRQIRHMGWMHNRVRMVVASFLSKDLLIDWRMGERFFMEHLIDGDFASNNGGWGFAASVGVDPQPYFRIFNPLLQSEKFDPDGEYIRRWIPELKEVKGKAIHDPYGRGAAAIAQKGGYPRAIVEHSRSRERALAAYKKGIGANL
ncbi:DNA photolyase phr1 [Cytospora paraplurivora]|uniref:DNA photolyase phr1 n=1 Tax=Cytospora paraplurivora TaxID=2898453 RepID=A0AAN9UA95_9PEZI